MDGLTVHLISPMPFKQESEVELREFRYSFANVIEMNPIKPVFKQIRKKAY